MAFRRKDLLGLRGIRRDEIEHILDTAVQMKKFLLE
ncbi:MAG: aspartate carbamoyltransferase, partial [Clostridiales bacterium]|nr:aspartate carbamoyltransferase [Clostridiales bacterium]